MEKRTKIILHCEGDSDYLLLTDDQLELMDFLFEQDYIIEEVKMESLDDEEIQWKKI